MDKLQGIKEKSSIVWGPLHSDINKKCDLFCGSKMSNRFINVDQGICRCFNETQLPTFDCDEVQQTSKSSKSIVLNVYCVHTKFSAHQAASIHPSIFESPRKLPKELHEENIEFHEDESFNVSAGIAPAAILLALISVAVLIIFACKSWYEHKKNKGTDQVEQAKKKDPKENNSESSASRNVTWNFDDYKIKESRSEQSV
ncbi:unnamed protein product [Lepeophtheirus salmonis]|uniref:(salmon louse) hypothetical protein n=2 Tax=Lepeophtheirus salmonis TaxID=72036 RepID=A0A7R8H4P3_LEPSM|nr:unnamed protein product [Lepeophtheirus salmonis]CAF2851936.1 unnamed protein product [Lepeophtheirus salmonis]